MDNDMLVIHINNLQHIIAEEGKDLVTIGKRIRQLDRKQELILNELEKLKKVIQSE